MYFDFTVIRISDDTQVIDRKTGTLIDTLTPEMQTEYMEISGQLAVMDRMKRRERLERERKQRRERNFLYRLACLCGLG